MCTLLLLVILVTCALLPHCIIFWEDLRQDLFAGMKSFVLFLLLCDQRAFILFRIYRERKRTGDSRWLKGEPATLSCRCQNYYEVHALLRDRKKLGTASFFSCRILSFLAVKNSAS